MYEILVQIYNDALVQMNMLNASKKSSLDEDCINLLASVLQRKSNVGRRGNASITPGGAYDESAEESSEGESQGTTARSGKKFPFRQTYD